MPLQKSTGHFWDLWRMFDMPGLSLARLYPAAALQQVGKVRWAGTGQLAARQGRQGVIPCRPKCTAASARSSRLCCPPPSPRLCRQLLGLFLLVCFGSCMDIAAIQSDTPFRLDFNAELAALGATAGRAGGVGWGGVGCLQSTQGQHGNQVNWLLQQPCAATSFRTLPPYPQAFRTLRRARWVPASLARSSSARRSSQAAPACTPASTARVRRLGGRARPWSWHVKPVPHR